MEQNKLPAGWSWVKLGDICEKITKGSTPTSYGFNYLSSGINFVKTENIDKEGNIGRIKQYIDNDTNDYLKRSQLKENDFLFSIAGTIGRIGKVKKEHLPANTNQALAIVRLKSKQVLHSYLYYYLYSPNIQKNALKKIVGVGRANLSLTNVSEFNIPLPPLKEQQKIVEKIEELFSELDNGIANLKKAKEQIKVYKQSVLKYAFEGKLLQGKMQNGKGKSENGGLPEGWKWMELGNLIDFIGSGSTPKGGKDVYTDKGIIFIRSQNVYPNELRLNDVVYISEEINSRLKRSKVKPNDVLLNITGASIGRATFVPKIFQQANVNQHVCIIRTSQKNVFPKYLSSFLNSPFAQSYIRKIQIGATRQALNYSQIKRFPFPLATMKEQTQIVEEIEKRFSVADKMEAVIDESLKKAEGLRQSILKQAFEGKLV